MLLNFPSSFLVNEICFSFCDEFCKKSFLCLFLDSLGVFIKVGDLKEDCNRQKAEDKQHKTDKSCNNVSCAIIRLSLFLLLPSLITADKWA